MLRILFLILAAVPALGQPSAALEARIERAPLAADQRQAVLAALSRKDFVRLESILGGPFRPDAPPEYTAELGALLGALEFVGGRMKEAVAAFRWSESLRPLDDHDRFTLAMALANFGDVQASRTQLDRLNATRPDQALYLYWLARLDYDQRLYDQAVEKLKRVVSLDPNSARGYDNLGLCYDMMGLMDEAQAAYWKAVTLNRKLASPSPWPPDNRGYFLLRRERFDEAEENLREALKYDPKFALAHYHLGRVLEKQDRDEAAMEEYRFAAALDEKLAEPLYSLGLLYRHRGRDGEAAHAFAEFKRRRGLPANAP